MSKVTKERLMDYLYDELSQEERREVEAYLEKHPEAKAELEELGGVRQTLRALPDRPVQRPILMVGDPEPNPTRVVSLWQRWSVGIAAALLLLATVAFIGRMQVNVTDSGFTLAFNPAQEQVTPPPTGLSQADMESFVEAALQKQANRTQDSLTTALASWKTSLQNQWASRQAIPAQSVSQTEGVSREQLETMLKDLQDENLQLMVALIQGANQEMQDDFQKTLFEMVKYYDTQRSQDLNQMELSFASLKQETEQAQQKTEYLYNVLATNTDD